MKITWQGNPDLGLPRTEHSAFRLKKIQSWDFFSFPSSGLHLGLARTWCSVI